ncbi:MAG TPA: reverse transcriptase family protein [Solirubrobacteraceae bacterium]|nr:reverse transcriptase family protein [Solirubrobacteraceae bacterium]
MANLGDRYTLASELTQAFLDASWTAERLAETGAACLGRWPAWMYGLTEHVVAVHGGAPLNRRRQLFTLILDFLDAHVTAEEDLTPWSGQRPIAQPQRERQVQPRAGRPPGLDAWQLPEIPTVTDLAERLELSPGQLEWLADVRGLERTVTREQLRNYRYLALPRRGAMPRVIEAPKLRLKQVQRWILREVLVEVPAHSAAHGFVAGRSVVSHAELHTGRRVVLRLDLEDFFASVPAGRVYRTWRTLGYDPSVAHVLTGLTTNVVPLAVWQHITSSTPTDAVQARFWFGRQLATPHLPQGAPTSPALANLAAFRLDRRLARLAEATGLRYSRYADDLTFSGGTRLIRRRGEFEALVGRIVRGEGFQLNIGKSMTQAAGGRQVVCGVVVNVRTNARRAEYDELRAILHNAARSGPASQNRDGIEDFRAHLLGRISWMEALNPGRGLRLRELYAVIDWS